MKKHSWWWCVWVLLLPAVAAGQPGWRLIDTISVSGVAARVEISALRTVRISANSGGTAVTTAGMRADSLRLWLDRLTEEMGHPDAQGAVFDSTMSLIPRFSGDFVVGYSLALTDSVGVALKMSVLPADVARLARVLVHAAEAGLRLSGSELARKGRVRFRAVERASSEIPEYPDSMRRAEIEDDVLLAFVVDTAGYARLGTVRLLEGRNRAFFDSVLEILPAMKFRPAEVEGHKYEDMVAIPFSFRLMK